MNLAILLLLFALFIIFAIAVNIYLLKSRNVYKGEPEVKAVNVDEDYIKD